MTSQAFGWATETRFLLEAQQRNLVVSRPVCDAPGYDAVVDLGGRLVRVQVKGVRLSETNNHRNLCHAVNCNRSGRNTVYDILAVYLHEENKWFFYPYEMIGRRAAFSIYPTGAWRDRAKGWEILR